MVEYLEGPGGGEGGEEDKGEDERFHGGALLVGWN